MPLSSLDLRKLLSHEEWQLLILRHPPVEEANVHFAFPLLRSLSNIVKLLENLFSERDWVVETLTPTADLHLDSMNEIFVAREFLLEVFDNNASIRRSSKQCDELQN